MLYKNNKFKAPKLIALINSVSKYGKSIFKILG